MKNKSANWTSMTWRTSGQALVWPNFGGHSTHWKRNANQEGCELKKNKNEATVNNTLVSTSSFWKLGASSNGIFPILPVQVKARKGNKVIHTHDLLDSESTSTFWFEALDRKLKLTGKRSKMCLLTMSPKTTMSVYIVNRLEISSFHGIGYYNLPNVCT